MLLLHLKTAIKQLLLPPVGLLLLALAGLLFMKRRPLLGRSLIIVSIASLWLLATPVIADFLTRLAEHYPPFDAHAATGAQAIVILGGGGQRRYAPEYAGPAAGPILLERLSYGAFIARTSGLPILVTGSGIEATAMHDTLARNFDIQSRWVDHSSYDTFENARNAARLLQVDGVHRIILVTHATHMWRSAKEFTAAGLEVIPAPVGIIDPTDRSISLLPAAGELSNSYTAINELLGEPIRAMLEATHLRSH